MEQLGDRATHTASRTGAVTRPTFQCPICRQWVNLDAVSLNVTLRDLLAELGRLEDKRYIVISCGVCRGRGGGGEIHYHVWYRDPIPLRIFLCAYTASGHRHWEQH